MTENVYITKSDMPNDIIDIYSKPKLTVKKLQNKVKNELRLELEGISIDNSIINALRRTVMMYIPIYGFHRSNIYIEVNKCKYMYNNDMIYNLIETLPIFDILNYHDLTNPELFLSNEVMRNIFSMFIQEKYVSDEPEDTTNIDNDKKLFKIELTLNVKNNTTDNKFVSTHDAILRVDGKIVNSYLIRRPISILVLKPNEEVSLRAEANLGNARISATYEATTNAVIRQLSPTKYHLWYETLEQLPKEIIFSKACTIIHKKLSHLREYVSETVTEEDVTKIMRLELNGCEHTIGYLLATILQKCTSVQKAGYSKPHPFEDRIVLQYLLAPTSKKKPLQILVDCMDYLIDLFKMIEHEFSKEK